MRSFGTFGAESGQLKYPNAVAADASGRIVVSDNWNHRVQVIPPCRVKYVAFVSLYISVQRNVPLRIICIVTSSTCLASMQAIKNHPVEWRASCTWSFSAIFFFLLIQFEVPTPHRALHQVFDADGQPIHALGSKGTGPGQLSYPTGLAVDREGRIVVTDSANHRIQVF